ncbi:hypothetical protein LOC68_01710 [Blastopirellula sp. JC732]|uniref:Uncharacterized protein n=1 Tax=Blastopirellula sediminis TaxID=2894196 RepID=A0A9X1MHY5_9BACT|nr:hypothetical protein [Blastopirellula sediminis]MCC9608096.1 hypothetical protein [Blastopirellula sediminis]MCC9627111.1 hypothetical protein [Blastopirellula sediminis]
MPIDPQQSALLFEKWKQALSEGVNALLEEWTRYVLQEDRSADDPGEKAFNMHIFWKLAGSANVSFPTLLTSLKKTDGRRQDLLQYSPAVVNKLRELENLRHRLMQTAHQNGEILEALNQKARLLAQRDALVQRGVLIETEIEMLRAVMEGTK